MKLLVTLTAAALLMACTGIRPPTAQASPAGAGAGAGAGGHDAAPDTTAQAVAIDTAAGGVPREMVNPSSAVAAGIQREQAPDTTERILNMAVVFPASVQQGAMVIGKVPPGSTVRHGERSLRVTPYGSVVFGIARDHAGPARVLVTLPDGRSLPAVVAVTPREWPAETIRGVPRETVKPSPAVAARIRREQALVTAQRGRDEVHTGFAEAFQWPVRGRISGRFGSHRVYLLPDGSASKGSAHSGMDIAAANGTPVRAPAAGVVTFADPGLYLTGGTLLLDHGHGISSNFLHLSRLDAAVGDAVKQGQVIGAVGATGRATGPHLHWGMNWFDVRIDPLLVLERAEQMQSASSL